MYHNRTHQFRQINIFNKSNSKYFNENDKIYIYSPSLHQDLYQKIIKCFTNYIPFHIIPDVLNEEDVDVIIDEIVNKKDFEKSDFEIETYESIEELKKTTRI